jgi:probable phosphoglycerate mutase
VSLNPTAFWFLRHGETDWNAEGLSQGHTDIPLNAVGLAQARRAALALVDRGIATIIASPLSRALRTAEIVAEALSLPVATDAGLMEVGFGVEEAGSKAASRRKARKAFRCCMTAPWRQ